MDDIAGIRKGIRSCAKMEKEKKMKYELKKTKYMMVKTEKEREEIVQENNTYNLLDETEKDWGKIAAIYKNKKENREKKEQKNTKGKDIQ